MDEDSAHPTSRLARARVAAGISQKELAARVRISHRHVQRLEAAGSTRPPKITTLYRLAWALGCERLSEIVEPEWLEWVGLDDDWEPDTAPPKFE
jgi:transcriptional regulator with XRE-family HTH domain